MTDAGVFTRDKILTLVLATLTVLSIYICYRIVEPFVPAMAFALALAVATQTPFNWLRRRIRGNTAAAAVAVILVAILIIGPVLTLLAYIIQLIVENVQELQQGTSLTDGWVALGRIPLVGPAIQNIAGSFRLDEQLGNLGRAIAARATGFVSGSMSVLTQLAITLFVLFFLYRDCGEAVQALRKLLPLSGAEADRLFERVGNTIRATVNGSITVALAQAALATVVYLALGVPAAVVWGSVTFLMALVPVLGTFLVWAPIAIYLALTGSYIKAIFLVAWGGLVVGSVDNILYPYLVGNRLRLHTVPTFFSVLGGIGLFGLSGLILGPMALAVTIALIDVWWHRTEKGHAAEDAMSRAAEDARRPGDVLQRHPEHTS